MIDRWGCCRTLFILLLAQLIVTTIALCVFSDKILQYIRIRHDIHMFWSHKCCAERYGV